MARITMHEFRPATDGWIEWHFRTWRHSTRGSKQWAVTMRLLATGRFLHSTAFRRAG